MARKIGVLQGKSEKPVTYVKKSVAHIMIRRLLAVWVIENLTIRRVAIGAAIPASRLTGFAPKPFIPERLPSHKVPGTKTIGPVAEQSRERQELIRAARHETLWAPIERAGISAILRPEL